jgi:two-component system, chemotaxis family, protein-glutamate methylesterase/glutaminase
MKKTRVLVVDDSITVRKYLIEVLAADPEFEIAGETGDGRQAVELCRSLRPDVITLDMMLPVMSGVAVTEYVMAYCPTPILIISASTNRGELYKTYDALAAGAVDVLDKPTGNETDRAWEQGFLASVKTASRIRVITHIRARLGGLGQPPRSFPIAPAVDRAKHKKVVAIGGSTGGPGAILEILRGLPSDFSLPILLVIHISDSFCAAFAQWLDGLSPLRVRHARDGEPLPTSGTPGVIMAPSGSHLIVEGRALRLTASAERNSCRPSIDILFESLAREVGAESAACLLTGMGRDGAAGLLAVCQSGGLTIAQDEATSVIFGMPREAIQLGAAQRILPLNQIAPAIAALACEPVLSRSSR